MAMIVSLYDICSFSFIVSHHTLILGEYVKHAHSINFRFSPEYRVVNCSLFVWVCVFFCTSNNYSIIITVYLTDTRMHIGRTHERMAQAHGCKRKGRRKFVRTINEIIANSDYLRCIESKFLFRLILLMYCPARMLYWRFFRSHGDECPLVFDLHTVNCIRYFGVAFAVCYYCCARCWRRYYGHK